MDFDGVLTDNYVYTSSDGSESVACSKLDSQGLALIRKLPVFTCVISSETNNVVSLRCQKLQLPSFTAVNDKGHLIKKIAAEHSFSLDQTIYLGNDVNDMPALDLVGFPVCVADSHQSLLSKSYYQTNCPGGRGAVREVCDIILRVFQGN